jgi:hypothetical protein
LYGDGFSYGDGKPNSEFVSNWKNNDQYLSWDFRLNEPAELLVTLKYNTERMDDKGQTFVELDGKKYPVNYKPVLPTGDPGSRIFYPSESITVGQIKLGAGPHQLKLTPGEYQGTQLMRPLSVTLNPSGK